MARIVLAHGILGFGDVLPDQPIRYFNGIKPLYDSQGHDTFCPPVAPLGSIKARSEALEHAILARWPDDGQPLYLLAHSMGGLDCRRMLGRNADLAARVRRLVTLSTPHWGTPVADNVLNPTPFDLFSPLALASTALDDQLGALVELTLRPALDTDLDSLEHARHVDCLCIGCDQSRVASPSPFFRTTALIGRFGDIANDGVVSLASASVARNPPRLFDIWPVDHGGAIGWPSGLVPPSEEQHQAHLKRYRDLLVPLLD